jgi:hypothetical protein
MMTTKLTAISKSQQTTIHRGFGLVETSPHSGVAVSAGFGGDNGR